MRHVIEVREGFDLMPFLNLDHPHFEFSRQILQIDIFPHMSRVLMHLMFMFMYCVNV